MKRRKFIALAGGGTAQLLALGVPAGRLHGVLRGRNRGQEAARTLGGRRVEVVASEPWGKLHRIAEGVYGLVSDPLAPDGAGRVTLCNGGFVAGSNGVLMVEAFGTAEGAAWMADQAERLTGLRPTHQVVTHYHRDHTDGLGGIEDVEILSTRRTRDLVESGWTAADSRAGRPLPEPVIDPLEPMELDLGGITARLVPRDGHTPSDVTVHVTSGAGQRSVFAGDLIWKDMFPNFVDALPGRLTQSVMAMGTDDDLVFVTGHGDLAEGSDVSRLVAVFRDVEEHAQAAMEAGRPAAEAAAEYEVPGELGEWFRFSQNYYERAFAAWYRSEGVEP
jgi:glyoxylase-like metal-dependent hydrolase (beta-lactamase superfamily II)